MSSDLLADVLLARAEATPDRVAFEHASPGSPVTTLSYAQLASRAVALAERLADLPYGPVLVSCPAGPDYVTAVFGTFLSGRPAVPASPARPGSASDRHRLSGILADSAPPVAVSVEPLDGSGTGTPIVVPPPGPEADTTAWSLPNTPDGGSVAVIQYTSGSTGTPRGVLVRHEALAANTTAIVDRFRLGPGSRALTWLPPFHDMGLVGGLLTPVAAGVPMRILAPEDFLKSPLWWLRQIDETATTHSGGPDFAYDLCLRRARSDDQLAGLDLSSWEVAFSGGEPVRRRTLAAFSERFAESGFRASAFLPCYGLAEATLMVSAGHWDGNGRTDSPVSCGRPVHGQEVVIVDPDQKVPVDGQGEIWVAGPHVTAGHVTGTSEGLFGDLNGVRHLRTGDLGSMRDGELVVSGRLKDVLIVRGVNHHAADIEDAALETVGWAGRCAAAFAIETGPGPVTVVILEAAGRRDPGLAERVRAQVLTRTGVRLDVVAIVAPRSLPRTTSGKIRRSAAREAFLAGEYGDGDGPAAGSAATDALAAPRSWAGARTELTPLVCGVLAEVCSVEVCEPTDRLATHGVDSMRAAEAAAALEEALELAVPMADVLTAATAQDVVAALLQRWQAEGVAPSLVRARIDRTAEVGVM
ncbi:fatty acyl-AMP ligase [Pseudonocardia sp. ICBG1142]|uniref:fatty acyl-AMP ligase n=1 Tax=Pseudonocardia sp. ICBG1142 TaxID=2846760 RepID=UPI001CF6EA76|nr:fatty acyl-AMP ligase [Pseudonocardia sp. ICBG1142]